MRIPTCCVVIMMVALVVGCSPKKQVTYGTVTKCQKCGTVINSDLHTTLATEKEAQRLCLITKEGYCQKCGNLIVKVKEGTKIVCEDCGEELERHVRLVAVKLGEASRHQVTTEKGLCRDCRRQRREAADAEKRSQSAAYSDTPEGAVACVKSYRPSDRSEETVTTLLAGVLTMCEGSGSEVEIVGWGAHKQSDSVFGVSFQARVNGDTETYLFEAVPLSGKVSGSNDAARELLGIAP